MEFTQPRIPVVVACFLALLWPALILAEPPAPTPLALALNYVIFENTPGSGAALVEEARQQVTFANAVWSTCGISFHLENLKAIDPKFFHLPGAPTDYFDLDAIRSVFSSQKNLLVVVTQKWNREGSLGQSKASAWTSLPTLAPYGTIIESTDGRHFGLVAHELGHYLNLSHASDRLNLMNPVVYDSSRVLEERQCEKARFVARTTWHRMLR